MEGAPISMCDEGEVSHALVQAEPVMVLRGHSRASDDRTRRDGVVCLVFYEGENCRRRYNRR